MYKNNEKALREYITPSRVKEVSCGLVNVMLSGTLYLTILSLTLTLTDLKGFLNYIYSI